MKSSLFICVKITPEMMAEAERRSEGFRTKYGNMGTRLVEKKEKIMKTGFVGEQISKYVYPNLQWSSSEDVDFTCMGKTFDVKSVGCNSTPELHHVGTVFNDDTNKDVDFYIFTRIRNDFSMGWITGFISRKDFFAKADRIKAGTENNNFTYEHDRFTIPYLKCVKPTTVFREKR